MFEKVSRMRSPNVYDVTEWSVGNPYDDVGVVINSIIADINNASAVMTASRSPVRIAFWTLLGLSALVSLVLLIVTLALPGGVAGRGVTLASEALGRPVSIGQAHFLPWRLAVVLDDVSIGDGANAEFEVALASPDGTRLITGDTLYVDGGYHIID